MASPATSPARPAARHARVLAGLSVLFALRVAGQALQRWRPVELLPPFSDWQGSSLSYPVLLSLQLVMLGVMVRICWRTGHATHRPHRGAGTLLAWLGGLYMAGSLLRIAVGITLPGAPAWFSAWISAVFHVVLAAFVLTLAHYHLRQPVVAGR